HVDHLIATGDLRDQAEAARLGRVSRARVTQILNLLNLAPDIQEELLFLTSPPRGRDPLTLRQVLPIAALADWRQQRRRWRSRSARGARTRDRARSDLTAAGCGRSPGRGRAGQCCGANDRGGREPAPRGLTAELPEKSRFGEGGC